MRTWSNTSGTGASQTPAFTQLVLNGGSTNANFLNGFVLFTPTARDLSLLAGGAGSVGQEAMRTSTTCYMRGLSENIRVQTSTQTPWLWRRICFASRDPTFRGYAGGDTPTTTNFNWVETSNGYARSAINLTVNAAPVTQANIEGLLFRGRQGVDWIDAIVAPLDTRRVDVKYDKTFKLHSGNGSGYYSEKKLWHPMNKNLVYDDDENGEVEDTIVWSVTDKRGMGDYHIIDMFSCLLGGTSTDQLAVNYNSSIYWHEK